jgi:hypothetical protein
MRKKHYLLYLLILLVAFSCRRRRDLPGFDTDILLPLASTSIGFDKLVTDSTAKTNADQSIDIVYRYPFYEYSLKDILKVPDTSVTVSAKLATANLSNSFLERKITLGQIADNMGTTGALIKALHGSNAVIPPIPPNSSNQATPIDANSFFKEADLTSGSLDLTIKNDLPIGVSDLKFKVNNAVGGQLILEDTFSLIGPGDSITRSYDLAGKHVEGSLIGTIETIGSPGSNGQPVYIDTNKAIVLQLKVRNLTASKATAIFPAQDLIVVNDTVVYDLGKARLKKMLIRSGKVKMHLFSTLQDTLYIDYKIPSAIKNNDTVHLFLKVNPAVPGGVQDITQELDLHDYIIDLTGRRGLDQNTFWNIFRASIDSTGKLIQLSSKDSVWIKYGLYDIIPEYAEGYLGQDSVTVGPSKVQIDAFKKVVGGNIDLKDISVGVAIDNGLGADAQINFNYFTSKNTAKGTTVALSSPNLSSPFIIARAAKAGYASIPKASEITFTPSNSNIKPFVENLPNEVNYQFNAYLNQNGNQGFTDFITYDSKLIASLDIAMPLAFKANNLQLVDTTDFSLASANINGAVTGGTLNFIFDNHYPITFTARVYFLDSAMNTIDSLFDNGVTISPSQLNMSTLRTQTAVKTIAHAKIDEAKLDRLKKAKKIIIHSSMNTDQPSYLKIYTDYKLNIKVTGEFTYHAGKK